MTRSIYIATYEAGRGLRHISQFDGRNDLIAYAHKITAMRDTRILANDSVDAILDKLADIGPGFGSRWHQRVSRRDAAKAIRDGAKSFGIVF